MIQLVKILTGTISLLCAYSLLAQNQENYERGLYFCSYEVQKDNRTSLNLTPEKSFDLENGFSMSFDIQLRKYKYGYGYIFRIIANDSLNIDFVSVYTDPGSDFFTLIVGDKSIINYNTNEFDEIEKYDWVNVCFSLDTQTKQLKIKINNNEKAVVYQSEELKTFDICFGANKSPSFSTTDVSTMNIRDIRIYDCDHKLFRYWELGKHGDNVVYDSCAYAKAIVRNPVWEIDSHVKWQKKMSLSISGIDPQITFDNQTGKIVIVKNNTILQYDVTSSVLDTLFVKKGFPYGNRANQLIYNSNTQGFVSYLFESDTLSEFNLKKKEWSLMEKKNMNPCYWHHSKQFLPDKNALLSVGGYGFHEYKKDILLYSFQEKKWERLDFDSSRFTPRYLGSLGYLGDGELLYFGGFGSSSGNQVESPKNFYDLFKIDINQKTLNKLWTLRDVPDHFVTANSMIVAKDKKTFYALVYSDKVFLTHLRLCQFNIESPDYKIFTDSIPFRFNDNESYCDLFYFEKTNQLYTVTTYSMGGKSEVEIYSINYPPLAQEDVFQKEPAPANSRYSILAGISLLAILAGIFLWKYKMRRRKRKALSKNNNENFEIEEDELLTRNDYDLSSTEKLKPSTLNLLGDFQIIDREGVDITGKFSTVLYEIFLLILFATIKKDKGISSKELRDILWFDKNSEKARNNLNVNVNRLRSLIKTVGNIDIINKESTWIISFDQDIFCDYKAVLSLIKVLDKDKTPNKEVLNDFLNYATKGILLSNLHSEWFDDYKSEYSNLIIDKLLKLSEIENIKEDLVLLYRIANAILVHDSLDEKALVKKCYALYYLEKKTQAKQCFEKFSENHKNLLGTDYEYTFNQFREKYLSYPIK
jgi:DNA-binding SARP family transcriptional activator